MGRLIGLSARLFIRLRMRWDEFPDSNRMAWVAMMTLCGVVFCFGIATGLGLKWDLILAAMLIGVWHAWVRTAKDARWSVAYAGVLLTGVTLALAASTLSLLTGLVAALWTAITAWRLTRAIWKREKLSRENARQSGPVVQSFADGAQH